MPTKIVHIWNSSQDARAETNLGQKQGPVHFPLQIQLVFFLSEMQLKYISIFKELNT